MEASSSAELIIGMAKVKWDEDSNELTKLDDKILSFHNLRGLTRLQIRGCQNLSCISLGGFRQLINLKSLEIKFCKCLFSSDVLPEHAGEDMADAGSMVLPCLEHLKIRSCGITGKWLSMMLQHATALEKLYLRDCDRISGLLIEGKGGSLSNHTCTTQASLAGNPDDTLTSSTPEGLLRIPSNLVSSLKEIMITWCNDLIFNGNREGFSGFTSLEKLKIFKCPKLIPSFMQKYENNDQGNGRWLLPHSLRILEISNTPETLQPCFLEDRNCLRELEIYDSPTLKFLQLYSCTALEKLEIGACESLATLAGNLTCLKKLVLHSNSVLESLQLCSCTALEELEIHTCKSLATLAGNLTCLKKLMLDSNSVLESLQLYSCTALEELTVAKCAALIALEGNFTCLRKLRLVSNPRLIQLRFCTALEQLVIIGCESLDTLEDMADAGSIALPSLEHLEIESCGITGKWLSVMLQHAPALEELSVDDCGQISALRIEGIQRSLSNHTCTPPDSSAGNPDGTLTSAAPEGLLRIPSNLASSLKKIIIIKCDELTFQGNKEGFSGLTSLEELKILKCPKLIPSLMQKYEDNDQGNGRWLLPHSLRILGINDHTPETLQPCFLEDRNCLRELHIYYSPTLKFLQLYSCTALEELTVKDCAALIALEGNFTCLRKLELTVNPRLKSLQLRFCTALEQLVIYICKSLDTLEGFRSLRGLRYLQVSDCPGLPHMESLLSQGYELCAGLERLCTDDFSFLTTSICKCLTSLQRLEFSGGTEEVTRLTHEQERAFQLLTSLQELRFEYFFKLADLPEGLHNLPSLKKLKIYHCSEELTDACGTLATASSKPKVKIDGEYVN